MDEHLDIFYSPASDSYLSYDLFVPQLADRASSPPPLICFVHGGAWRSEDKSDHTKLARNLAHRTGYAVAVPNYRLTKPETPIQHPAHSEDILQFLTFIRDWNPPAAASPAYDRDHIYLIGHSCSAHMLTSILLSSPFPSLSPTDEILRSVRGVVFSEGIYDIDALLQSFPSYGEWFIVPTFGDRGSHREVSVSHLSYRAGGTHVRFLIVHSTGDTLVDLVQSQAMYAHLVSLEGGEQAASTKIQKNFDSLDKEHNDILRLDEYVEIVARFLLKQPDVNIV